MSEIPQDSFDPEDKRLHYAAMAAVLVETTQEIEETLPAMYQDAGILKEAVNDPRAEWTGAISLAQRKESGEITDQYVEKFISLAKYYYVRTKEGATIRCIDARTRALFDAERTSKEELDLGPQIPGGTLGGAVAFRQASSTTFSEFKAASLLSDVKYFADKGANAGFQPGNHTANHHAPGKTGCGAVDGVEASHRKVRAENYDTIFTLMKAVLGPGFSDTHSNAFALNASFLRANAGYFKELDDALELLQQSNKQALPELVGEHKEVVVFINLVEGETLANEHLNAVAKQELGKELQAFNFDFWFSQKVAKELFPHSVEMQSRYVHSRLGMAITTLMHLTDGSLRVVIRRPEK